MTKISEEDKKIIKKYDIITIQSTLDEEKEIYSENNFFKVTIIIIACIYLFFIRYLSVNSNIIDANTMALYLLLLIPITIFSIPNLLIFYFGRPSYYKKRGFMISIIFVFGSLLYLVFKDINTNLKYDFFLAYLLIVSIMVAIGTIVYVYSNIIIENLPKSDKYLSLDKNQDISYLDSNYSNVSDIYELILNTIYAIVPKVKEINCSILNEEKIFNDIIELGNDLFVFASFEKDFLAYTVFKKYGKYLFRDEEVKKIQKDIDYLLIHSLDLEISKKSKNKLFKQITKTRQNFLKNTKSWKILQENYREILYGIMIIILLTIGYFYSMQNEPSQIPTYLREIIIAILSVIIYRFIISQGKEKNRL